MSDSDDIVERLRAAAAYEAQRDRPTLAALLTEAAELIERQRGMIANWEAAFAVQRITLARYEATQAITRGSMVDKAETDVPPFVILPAEPSTPR